MLTFRQVRFRRRAKRSVRSRTGKAARSLSRPAARFPCQSRCRRFFRLGALQGKRRAGCLEADAASFFGRFRKVKGVLPQLMFIHTPSTSQALVDALHSCVGFRTLFRSLHSRNLPQTTWADNAKRIWVRSRRSNNSRCVNTSRKGPGARTFQFGILISVIAPQDSPCGCISATHLEGENSR